MQIDLFNATFWGGSFWQGLGVLLTFAGIVVGPFVSIAADRLFHKNEQQDHISAYKALLLTDRSLTLGEGILFLPIQAAAAYGLYVLGLRVWLVDLSPTVWFEICAASVLLITWGLSAGKRRSLAVLLTWQFCLTMVLFCLLLAGNDHGTVLITKDLTFVKHAVGQYLPREIQQIPPIGSLKSVSLRAVPIDFTVSAPNVARTIFIWLYGILLFVFLFFYTLHKRHYAKRMSAFVRLSDKERKDQMDLLDYQDKQTTLEIKGLEKQEKERELELSKQQTVLLLEKERLAVEKERLAVDSARLDLEKKRSQYTLELATLLIDTLHSGVGNPDVRAELLRNTLPSLKDFGKPNTESTTLVLEHLEALNPQVLAIPASVN